MRGRPCKSLGREPPAGCDEQAADRVARPARWMVWRPNVGSKGLGEPPIVPTASAIANAFAHATGRRAKALPLTRDRVLETLA